MQVLFMATHMSKHTLLLIYTEHSKNMSLVVHRQQHTGNSEINFCKTFKAVQQFLAVT